MQQLTLLKPDDWHVHLRDDAYLQDTVKATAQTFKRALVMPNLNPALTSLSSLLDYRARILAQRNIFDFEPYMTFYLNEHVLLEDLNEARLHQWILGAKWYPHGVTTHSDEGVAVVEALFPHLACMQDQDLVLQIHGEVFDADIFDRERVFLETVLPRILKNFPKLRVVLEHISTKAAVDFVQASPETLAATITPHHLLYDRNHLLSSGIKPHYYCLPILKRASDQQALLTAATSLNPKFFAGTDSAPHAKHAKESACGCAGIYSAPHALLWYATAFEQVGQLEALETFVSRSGALFYQLPVETNARVTLVRQPTDVPRRLSLGFDEVIPMGAGETLSWSLCDD